MTDQRRTEGGYRGALPPRNDVLARWWVIAVVAAFVLIFVLALAGLPSRLFPEETATPQPSFSLAPSGSGAASPSALPSVSGGPSGSPLE